MQCLFHLPHFNDYFAEQRYLSERSGRSQDVVELYRALYLAVMRRGSESEISTLPLKKSVCTPRPTQPRSAASSSTGSRRTPTSS